MIAFGFLSRFQFSVVFILPPYFPLSYVGDSDHQQLLNLGKVAEMPRGVPSPAPAAGNGAQSMYMDSHSWPFSGHPLLLAPAEFDGSGQ